MPAESRKDVTLEVLSLMGRVSSNSVYQLEFLLTYFSTADIVVIRDNLKQLPEAREPADDTL